VDRVPAYILAGGQSRRFQRATSTHQDKARTLIKGKPLILHVAESATPIAETITVVAESPGKYDDLGLRTIADHFPGMGPVAGIHAALSDTQSEWILVLSCDWLGLRPEWLAALLENRVADTHVVLYKDTRWQPLCALYHQSLSPTLLHALQAEQLALTPLIEQASKTTLTTPSGWERLVNVNTVNNLPLGKKPT
jgi:molybdenum cofactor guanylyltransferase